jgi:hypothetical protein
MTFPTSDAEFAELWNSAGTHIDLGTRFPAWPFRAATGFATIYEYDRVLGGGFGAVLHELSRAHSDEAVTIVGLEPNPSYYADEYGFFPAVRIAAASIRTDYGAALRWEPHGDPTGSLGDTLNVVAIVGSSGAWSVFAQRDWEIGLLLTLEDRGGWMASGVPWFRRDVELDSIRSPAGWGATLIEEDLASFARHLRERGSGH